MTMSTNKVVNTFSLSEVPCRCVENMYVVSGKFLPFRDWLFTYTNCFALLIRQHKINCAFVISQATVIFLPSRIFVFDFCSSWSISTYTCTMECLCKCRSSCSLLKNSGHFVYSNRPRNQGWFSMQLLGFRCQQQTVQIFWTDCRSNLV